MRWDGGRRGRTPVASLDPVVRCSGAADRTMRTRITLGADSMKPLLAALFGSIVGLVGPNAPALGAPEVAKGALDGGKPRVEARLLVHPDRLDADHVRAGVLLTADKGWHLY